MGEIADALRRAHAEQADRPASPSPEPAPPHDPREDVYSESGRLYDAEQAGTQPPSPSPESVPPSEPGTPSPPAPAPSSRSQAAPAPTQLVEVSAAVELTHFHDGSLAAQGVLIDEGNAITDACLQLALRVRKALESQQARTLAVVSAMRGEGKTTVSCNLALALASLGQIDRVALVDLDLRRPSLQRVLELDAPHHGIEDVLVSAASLDGARVRISSPALDVYPCLRGQAKAHEPLLRLKFEQVVQELRDRYEVVIFDSPPTLLVPDATIIMQHVERFAPVARAGLTRSRNFKKMLETLPRRRILGAILDGEASPLRKGYYDHYSPEPDPPKPDPPDSAEAADVG